MNFSNWDFKWVQYHTVYSDVRIVNDVGLSFNKYSTHIRRVICIVERNCTRQDTAVIGHSCTQLLTDFQVFKQDFIGIQCF